MDRLSGLPEAILHDILSRLPDKDAAKTSALSKVWRDTWSSFPNLSICSQDFFTIRDVSPRNSHRFSKMDILIDSVTKRLMRLGDQGLAIKEFKLDLRTLFDRTYVSHHIDQWIKMASECGIEVLELHLTNDRIGRDYSQDKWYDLPLCVIEAKSLTKLVLDSGIRIDQEFLSHSMKFSSLKLLSLSWVLLSTEVPQVYRIYWVKSLFLNGLQKLKQVEVLGMHEVHVDSPNLENLCYSPSDDSAPVKLNFDSCTNLRCLCVCRLQGIDIGDKWFLELFSKFPFLEKLTLLNCSMSQSINISSTQLKVLELSHCSNLKEVNIYAQNILSFVYRGINQPAISFLRSSKQLEVKGYHCSLREFVQNIKPQRVLALASVSLFIYQSFRIKPKQGALKVSSIPPSIKCVELLSTTENEALYFPFMSYLFSSCCPKSISFRLSSVAYSKAFIEFFYEILMGKKEGKCHCSSSNTKCWWHALKIVKVTCSFKIDENADFKTMLDAFPKCNPDENIGFILEL